MRQIAIKRFKHPKHGPYAYMDDALIAKLFAHWSFTATVYKEGAGIASLPDLAVGLVEYNAETELAMTIGMTIGDRPRLVQRHSESPRRQ